MPTTPTPRDYDPYRAEIRDCQCDICYPMCYVRRTAEDHARHERLAIELLTALKAGTHTHMTMAQRSAIARAEHDARVAEACASGVTERRMATLIRGYATDRDSDRFPYGPSAGMSPQFVHGTGLGMSQGRYAAAQERRDAADARYAQHRDQEIERRIAADHRYRCVAFRFTNALCAYHAEHGTGGFVSGWAGLAPVAGDYATAGWSR